MWHLGIHVIWPSRTSRLLFNQIDVTFLMGYVLTNSKSLSLLKAVKDGHNSSLDVNNVVQLETVKYRRYLTLLTDLPQNQHSRQVIYYPLSCHLFGFNSLVEILPRELCYKIIDWHFTLISVIVFFKHILYNILFRM